MPSKIERTEETWNPVTGCTKVSPGCANCYAERMAKRLAGRCGYPKDNPFAVMMHYYRLEQPIHWHKPRTIFVCSMGDLFHPEVSFEFIDKVFAVMALCPQHTFQVLTKRADRMRDYFAYLEEENKKPSHTPHRAIEIALEHITGDHWPYIPPVQAWPLPNLWLGVSAENQEMADERIPLLLQTPAAERFVSVEPMLGEVDFKQIYDPEAMCCVKCGHIGKLDEPYETDYETPDDPNGWAICPECGGANCGGFPSYDIVDVTPLDMQPFPDLDWVICGGESGPGARLMQLDWARSLRDQCVEAGVPFFLKQMKVDGNLVKMPELDGKIWDQMPEVSNG